MSILVIKIENLASLLLNEFYDYNGQCWAVSRDRMKNSTQCIALEDFYESTIQTQWMDDIPVIFVYEGQIIGWYEKARVYRNMQTVSAFIEGNIVAAVKDARLLAGGQDTPAGHFDFKDQFYQVIDEYDAMHGQLMKLFTDTRYRFVEIRKDRLKSSFDGNKVRLAGGIGKKPEETKDRMIGYCVEQCGELAYKAMNDQCKDIRDFMTLYDYASELVKLNAKNIDGQYYLAMACEQLGLVKEGMKAIEKALAMEPDGDDLLALKGHLLLAMGKYEQAAQFYQEACEISPSDGYLLCLGQAYQASGQMDMVYKTYKKVSDQTVFEQRGIDLKDMEHRWPFVAIRHFFGKKQKVKER